ncbi:MAG: VCBS repeat-containing protein, partial [Planctomycetes bacterium]|nr:VCBS repeat-containing protein [Planctomycetota bacterium]
AWRAADQAHWPMPDYGSGTSYEYFLGSPLCLDVNGDGRNEIIQMSVDYSDFLGGGRINIWDEEGRELHHWPVTLEYAWPTSVAVGDIDGDGDYEVIVACEYEGEVYAYHVETGKLVAGQWPAAVGGWYGWIPSGPVLADLDGDGDSEILIGLDMESPDTDGLIAIQADGTFLWQRRYTSAGPISAADLNKDGQVEIALSGYGPDSPDSTASTPSFSTTMDSSSPGGWGAVPWGPPLPISTPTASSRWCSARTRKSRPAGPPAAPPGRPKCPTHWTWAEDFASAT